MLIGGATAFWLMAEKFYYGLRNELVRDVTSQPLFFVSLTSLIIGSQLFMTGFLGEMYSQATSGRKSEYQIAETANLN
jgi:hypothetical protein